MAEGDGAMVAHTAVSEPALRADIPSARGAALSIHEVSHCFELEGRPLPVLERISLRVEPGEFVAIGCRARLPRDRQTIDGWPGD